MVIEGPSLADKARLHRSAENNQRHIELRNCFRVRVRWLHITSVNPEDPSNAGYGKQARVAGEGDPGNEGENAFTMNGCANCDVEDCNATDVHSYVTCASPYRDGSRPTRYSAFRRIHGLRCGGWGFAAVYCHHIDVDDINYDKCGWGAADFEANTGTETIMDLTFRRWTVDTPGFGVVSHQDGIVQDILFEDCHVKRHNYNWGMVDIRNANPATNRGKKRRITVRGWTNEWHPIYDTENGGLATGGPWGHLFTFTTVDDVTVEDNDLIVRNVGSGGGGLTVVAMQGATDEPGFVRVRNNRAKGGADGCDVAYFNGVAYDLTEETICGNEFGANYELTDGAC